MDRDPEPGEYASEPVLNECEYCGEPTRRKNSLCKDCKFPEFSPVRTGNPFKGKKGGLQGKPIHNKKSEWTMEEKDAFLRRNRGWTIGKGWDL